MTRCSDNDEQSDDGEEQTNKNQKKKSKGEKHVSFPPDEQIVSGFAEHRSTDRQVDSCLTLTEVMVAYQQSCSRHQVQPREHVLQQLQQGVCVGGSVKCLDLKVGALKSNRSLQELHLTNNLLNSYQDALQLGDLLRYNSTLLTLELSNNSVADAGLEELCDGLRLQTAGLRVLLLRNNQITAAGMVHLAKALPVLKVLQVLDLGENLLGNEGIQAIREPLMVNSSVLQLGLAQADITCEGAVALAEFLAESRQIQQLDLRQNEVKVGGLMALCLALRINRSLANLHLDHTAPQEQFLCVHVCDQQDELLMETQTRLQSEIIQRCLASRSHLATEASETPPAEADGRADSMTTA
ncbi:Protein phosphatase 1 regulatory subunit 37 [Nibea albiflora]|uniref:Protein phosphatase 1 regulatory subunit 37 n=1 Tax=Nibea albiflora TaxID=240163 RepID=A0ACB7FHR5_NIBAL|nr:Protein phosphatase 1 regulatory subunit 37 [Nibea albiflora]